MFSVDKNICKLISEWELKPSNNLSQWQMDLWVRLYQCNETLANMTKIMLFRNINTLKSNGLIIQWLLIYNIRKWKQHLHVIEEKIVKLLPLIYFYLLNESIFVTQINLLHSQHVEQATKSVLELRFTFDIRYINVYTEN